LRQAWLSPSAPRPAAARPAASAELAARRLLILMLILLGISSVIAVVIPNPRRDAREREARLATGETGAGGGTSGKTGTTGDTGTGATGELQPGPARPESAGTAGARAVTVSPAGRPETIRAKTGGRLILTVETKDPSQVMIPALGRTGFADRWAPAVFDLVLPARTGPVPVFTTPPDGLNPTRRTVIRIGQ